MVAQNDHFILYRPKRDDTLRSVAQRFLGDEKRGWEIADFNDVKELTPEVWLPFHCVRSIR